MSEFKYPSYPIRIGTEDKDLITECTAAEFRAWMKENGMDIDFMSDRNLDAEDETFRHRLRYAFILELKALGDEYRQLKKTAPIGKEGS